MVGPSRGVGAGGGSLRSLHGYFVCACGSISRESIESCKFLTNLVMYRLPHEKKNYGFTPNLDFNSLPTRFNLTEFLSPSGVCSTSGEKRTSKHGISVVSAWY